MCLNSTKQFTLPSKSCPLKNNKTLSVASLVTSQNSNILASYRSLASYLCFASGSYHNVHLNFHFNDCRNPSVRWFRRQLNVAITRDFRSNIQGSPLIVNQCLNDEKVNIVVTFFVSAGFEMSFCKTTSRILGHLWMIILKPIIAVSRSP